MRFVLLTPVLAGVFLSGLATAQQTPPQEPKATFSTNVNEVMLDMVVRDSKGRPVKNLKAEDVQVFENGVRQEIKSFRLVTGREALQQVGEGGKRPAPPKVITPGVPLPAVNLLCIVFYNIDPNAMKFTMDAVKELLDREMQPGTGVAFFNLGAHLTALQKFTTNRKDLMDALANLLSRPVPNFNKITETAVSASPMSYTVTVSGQGDVNVNIGGGEINLRAVTGADVGQGEGQRMYRALMADERRAFNNLEGMRQWDEVKLMLDELGPLPGRKTVLLLSGGITATGEPDLFQILLDKANKGQISIYAFDVNGLDATYSPGQAANNALNEVAKESAHQDTSTAGGAMRAARIGDMRDQAVRSSDTQASLRALAEGTGGFLIANTNDLKKPFQKLFEDVSAHYEAVYKPASSAMDGRLRRIEVKLARPEWNVQSRTGYFALPDAGPGKEPNIHDIVGLAAINAPQPPHAFDFQTAAYHFRPTPQGSQQMLAFRIPGSSFTATPLGDGKRQRLGISLLAVVKDSSGTIVDRFSLEAPFVVPAENVEPMRKASISFTHPVDLPPGHYTVDTAVFDVEANRCSVSKTEFDNKESKGPGLSSVVLVQQADSANQQADPNDPFQIPVSDMQSRRIVPNPLGIVSAKPQPFVYLVVYPDKNNAEKPMIELEYLQGGKSMAKQSRELPAPNASGAIPLVLRAAGIPGKWELRVTAQQGTASTTRTLDYTVTQ